MNLQETTSPSTSICSKGHKRRSIALTNGRAALAIVLTLFALFDGTIIYAQEENPPANTQPAPKTPQQEALEQEIAILKLKKERAETQKAIRDALPVPSVTALDGKTTLSTVSIEPEMMAYRAMTNVAYIISGDIHNSVPRAKAIAIYNAKEVKDWRFYQAMHPVFESQMTAMKTEYEGLLPKSADERRALSALSQEKGGAVESLLGGAFLGSSVVKSFIDLTSLFRTDTEIAGVSIEISENALVPEVVHALKERYPNIKIYDPSTVPPQLQEGSPTIALLKSVFEQRMEGGRVVRMLESLPEIVKAGNERIETLTGEISKLEGELKEKNEGIASNEEAVAKLKTRLRRARPGAARQKIEKSIQKLEAANKELSAEVQEKATLKQDKDDEVSTLKTRVKLRQQDIEKNQDKLARLKALNEQFDSFVGEFLKQDATTGQNALSLFVKSENLNKIFEGNEAYWLDIKPVKAGGNNRTRRNLIRYLTGAKTDHSGGFVVAYSLFDKEGVIAIADKYAKYEGYKDAKEIISWVDAFDKRNDDNGNKQVASASAINTKQRK
jgi:hypothetical protein